MNRYTLCAPEPDGDQYWQINDQKDQMNLVSIHKSFPIAERIARLLFWLAEHYADWMEPSVTITLTDKTQSDRIGGSNVM